MSTLEAPASIALLIVMASLALCLNVPRERGPATAVHPPAAAQTDRVSR